MKSLALTLLLALAWAPVSWGKPEKIATTPLPNGLKVQEYRLGNGMRILLVPDSSAPVITYQMWFRVGSVTEKMDPKLERSGLAHLFEHMMFRGTKSVGPGQFEKLLTTAGATGLNATTSYDRTNYYQSLPKDKLELVFRLESDRMVNLIVDEKLFKTELGAVFGEKKLGEDKPSRMAFEQLFNLVYQKHPYRATVIGSNEDLNSFTAKEANYFYRTYYAPNNATLILLGDFSVDKALALAEKYYGKLKAQEIPQREAEPEPEQKEARKKEMTHHLATADFLMLAYPAVTYDHKDTAALNVLGSILAVGDGSLLEQELVQDGIASSVSAGVYSLQYPGVFILSINMAPGKSAKDALKIVHSAFERIRKGELSPADLERAKNQYLLQAYEGLLEPASLGRTLGEPLMAADSYTLEFEILEQVRKLKSADLQRIVSTYIKDEKENLVHLRPGAKGDSK